MATIEWDPIESSKPTQWKIPSIKMNLRHYLSKLKYPPKSHDPIRMQAHFYDQKACTAVDDVRRADYPVWTSADSSQTAIKIFPTKHMVLGINELTLKKTIEEMEKMEWTLSPTDQFQPYTPMELNFFNRMPAQLRGKIDENHIFDMLCNEKAFLTHVHARAHSPDTPDAYLEILKIAPLQAIYKRLVLKAVMMLLSTCKASANENTTLTIAQLITDFRANFKSRMIMLFVTTIALSCDVGFLNGDHYRRAMGLRNVLEWENFEKYLRQKCFTLRHNMDVDFIKKKTDQFLDKQARTWPRHSEHLATLKEFFNSQYESTALLTQASDQLARLFWMLDKCPGKIAHNFRYVLQDPQVRRRLEKYNKKLDQNHLRRIAADEDENAYVLSYANLVDATKE